MALTPRAPENKSFVQPTKFQLSFARIPNFVFFLQTFNLPGVSMSEVIRHTPFVDLNVPGDKLIYDALSITFLVDEDMRAWMEIHDWLRGMTFPTDFSEYRNMQKDKKTFGGQYSDAILTVNTNANLPNLRFKFKDCFPTSVGTFTFDMTSDANQPVISDASFRFNYYDVERV